MKKPRKAVKIKVLVEAHTMANAVSILRRLVEQMETVRAPDVSGEVEIKAPYTSSAIAYVHFDDTMTVEKYKTEIEKYWRQVNKGG